MKQYYFILLSLLCFQISTAQEVTGKIIDSEGLPVPSVNIIEKGTSNGVIGDFDGNFTITVSENATLVFSFLGYQPKEVKVNGQTTINVTLIEGVGLDEIVLVGSRNPKRTITDSAVPVDVLDVAEIASTTGKVEVNEILQYAAPSFNASKQSGSDGADHVVPASLRGLGPDQTLVLINGKRRHQSSLVNIFGTRGRGNSGTDLNAIPASAIKRIEVLRDGASAQYGSDAIAGVINIVLKDNTEGFSGSVTYGAYSTAIGDGWEEKTGETLYNVEGKNRLDGKDKSFDGETVKVDFNYGVDIGQNGGYINFTTELLSKDNTLRPGFSWRKGYGSAGVDSFNFMINTAIPIDDNTEIYAFGGRNFRDTDAYAFSRDSFEDGDNRSVPSLYPDGFTPRITSNITDVSVSAGVKHEMSNGWTIDFNNTFGKNNFHYYVKDSNNASMQDASPIDFNAGGHFLSQNTTGLALNKYFEDTMSGLSLAFGMEYRTENFGIFAGEIASYSLYDENGVPITNPATQIVATDSNGDALPGGSQGFPGYSPDNEVDRSRTNYGIYIDSELNVTDDFLVGGALRFENYSDFGETFNFKLASRYKLLDDALAIRGSISTGFRAPSLAQLYYNLIFTNIVAGESIPSLLSANNSTVTKAFGIEDLKEEKAFNASVGFTFNTGGFTATIDGYLIDVKDRIILTDNFTDQAILGPLNVDAAQFFANGVDTQTTGLDIVLSYKTTLGANGNLNINLIGNLNDLKIDSINTPEFEGSSMTDEEAQLRFFSPFSQAYLEAAAPKYKFGLNLGYSINKFNINATLTQFSEVILQDFQWVDSPPTTFAEADALKLVATDTYEARLVADISLGYKFTEQLNLTIGANNLFNTYPSSQFDGWSDQGGLADSVQMGSDGRYIFSRLGFSF
ncbi:TonB-dependent receptor [Formosa algae]|uniref:Iron complex outermembrane receptor protein n=1 Tax=Formosa algae TaxID=225843 RepID=A0A9X1C9C9_9FLAO|nr:TonB-dependent receptor [Formosa algae]MBP1840856.1 iron complex outermembrane receptor protein [Formosa algae]MDQ0336247.1 iron complex outermembrane receptor protein [Formosa algae]OEI80018.1 TonB-dependent receptor [Formosa algae]